MYMKFKTFSRMPEAVAYILTLVRKFLLPKEVHYVVIIIHCPFKIPCKRASRPILDSNLLNEEET